MKKGFTIVELMASIVILSIISLLGVATYRNVSERIKIRAYENKVSLIESKAALFANDTGYLRTNVNELICEGYLEYDEEPDKTYTCGKILNPIDNSTLNEHIVDITREGENFYGNFTQIEQLDIDEIDRENINMEILVTDEDGNTVNGWTNQNVDLTAKINEEINYQVIPNINNNIKMVTWYNGAVLVKQCKFENGVNLTPNEAECSTIENSFKHQVTAEQILNTNYRIEVKISTDGDGTTIYQASKIVRIDKQKPIAYKDDIKVENINIWTNKDKETTIIGTDQNGSGIASYYIGTSETCTDNTEYNACDSNNKNCNPEKYKYGASGNGTYYVCAKDKAGNIGNATQFIIEKIDKDNPSCTIKVNGTPNANGWYNSAVTFNVTPSDSGGSGIQSIIKPEKLEDTNSNGKIIEAVVFDGAGNKGTCATTTAIKIDTKAPECTKSGDSTTWATSRSISWGCTDDGSGCDPNYSGGSVTYNNTNSNGTEITTIELGAYTIKDSAGNENKCSAETRSIYVDLRAPTIPTVTLNKWADNDVTPEKPAQLGGIYTSESWSNKNIYTEASGSTDTGAGGVYYQYTTTGTTTNETTTSTTRNVKANGVSYIAYRACDKFLNCSDYSTEQTIMIDKVKPNTPTINAYKWATNDDSSKPTSSTDLSTLSSYTKDTWTNSNLHFQATSTDPDASNGSEGSGMSYYMFTVTGAATNVKDSTGRTRNIKKEGTSYIKFKACDNAGNCSDYTNNFKIKIDKTAPYTTELGYVSGAAATNPECTGIGSYFVVTYNDDLSGMSHRYTITWHYTRGTTSKIDSKPEALLNNGSQDILCIPSGATNRSISSTRYFDKAGNYSDLTYSG